jgi:hypothetical protein
MNFHPIIDPAVVKTKAVAKDFQQDQVAHQDKLYFRK